MRALHLIPVVIALLLPGESIADPQQLRISALVETFIKECRSTPAAQKCDLPVDDDFRSAITIEENNETRVRVLNKDGAESASFGWRQTKPHGQFTVLHKNDEIRERGNFEDGMLVGTLTVFNDLGIRLREYIFDAPYALGTAPSYNLTEFHRNGKIAYKAAVQLGTTYDNSSYDFNGKEISRFKATEPLKTLPEFFDPKDASPSPYEGSGKKMGTYLVRHYISEFKNGRMTQCTATKGNRVVEIIATRKEKPEVTQRLFNDTGKQISSLRVIPGNIRSKNIVEFGVLWIDIDRETEQTLLLLEVGKKTLLDTSEVPRVLVKITKDEKTIGFPKKNKESTEMFPISEDVKSIYDDVLTSYHEVKLFIRSDDECTSLDTRTSYVRAIWSAQEKKYFKEIEKACRDVGFAKICP